MKTGVIIVAAGQGTRMGASLPKQFISLAGKPIVVHSVERFRKALPDSHIVVVVPADWIERWKIMARQYGIESCHTVCAGGDNRFVSVRNGLAALDQMGECDYIAVHDGVRPLVSEQLIRHTLDFARQHHTAVPAVEVTDSFRAVTATGSKAVDRTALRAIQTPQIFESTIIHRAFGAPCCDSFTDESSVVEQSGITPSLCRGERSNIKITTAIDLQLAECLIASGIGGNQGE